MYAPDLIQNIPLDKLVKSPRNARKTPSSETASAELKASIAVHGLQQNLVVAPANGEGTHEVIAGGRRLAALKALQAEGKLPPDCVVPCLVRTEQVAELSLAENIVREAMHPADQFEAFAALVDTGETVPGIAARFGVSEKLVRQRLKLGKVAPKLLAAYRAEEMDLETLTAFTLSDSHKRQLAVWKQVRNEHCGVSPHTVRRLLTEKAIAAGSRLGRFVGVKAYEQAGGRVTRDLFSERDEGYLDDVKLVHKLALQKLETKAKELEATWKWAKPMLEPDYGFTAEFARVYPQPVDVPAEVTEELEHLDRREDELMSVDEDDWTEELEAEADQLAARREELQQIVQEHVAYSEDDCKRAGCIVTIGHDGDFQLYEGLIPRDEIAGEGDGHDGEEPGAMPLDEPVWAPLSGEQAVRKAHGFSQGLIDDLKAHRLQITKGYLAEDFEAAFDVALYSLCIDILHLGYRANPLDLRAVQTHEYSSLGDLKDTPAARRLAVRHEGLDVAWLGLPTAEGFAEMCALSSEAKQALFAWCIAQTLQPQLAFEDKANPVIEQVGGRLGFDFAAHWRPTADNYWGRVRKSHALEVGAAVLGDRWERDHAKDKKPVLAKAMEAAFAGDGVATLGLDPETAARASAWVPPGMAYGVSHDALSPADADTVDAPDRPDDEPDTDTEAETVPAFLTADTQPADVDASRA
ncbi:MAG: ParB/RepB/Spo0J family partition protein [Kiloniellales bacterium]